MESYEQCGQGRSYCSLCTLDTIHTFLFVTRLIINKTNKVQWGDLKLENVLVSLHSLKTMGIGPFGASAPLFLRNGELLGHSPIHNFLNTQCLILIILILEDRVCFRRWIVLKKYTRTYNTHTIVNWKQSAKCYWRLWNITNMTSLTSHEDFQFET